MCEARSTHCPSAMKSTRDRHMIATVSCLVDERVSISRLRVVMTSRRSDVCPWLFDSAAAIPWHSAFCLPSALIVSKEQGTMVQSRGFIGRRAASKNSLQPGQYATEDFPVLSAGPTPHVPVEQWEFTIVTVRMSCGDGTGGHFASCRPSASPQISTL